MPSIASNRTIGIVSSALLPMLSIPVAGAATCSADDILLTFEEPAPNGYYSSIGNVRGWAWSPCGIDRIELIVDGELYGRVPIGGVRNDVAEVMPPEQFPGSDRSGYSMAYNYANLEPGEHTFAVRAIQGGGNSKTASARFITSRFGQNFTADIGQVDLSDADFTLTRSGIKIGNATVNGSVYDFELNWRDAAQGFNIEKISGRFSDTGARFQAGASPVSDEACEVDSAARVDSASPAIRSAVQNEGTFALALEEPVDDGGYSSVNNIRGWAVSSAGVDRVELFLDGEYFANIPLGGTRRDVAAAYPPETYPGSGESGFSMAWNYANLTPGVHSMRVVAYDNSGRTQQRESTFTVNRFDTSFLKGESLLNMIEASARKTASSLTLSGIKVESEDGEQRTFQTADNGDEFSSRLEFDPASQRFLASNVYKGGYRWKSGPWTECQGECGLMNASRSRTISCWSDVFDRESSEAQCPAPKPPAQAACTACDTYGWYIGAWGDCTGSCGRGAGSQSRTVECRDGSGNPVHDCHCQGKRPDGAQSCSACDAYQWYVGDWSLIQFCACTGDGDLACIESRQVFCEDSAGQPADEVLCGGEKPDHSNVSITPDDSFCSDDPNIIPIVPLSTVHD